MVMVEWTGPSVASVLEQLEIVKGVSVKNRGYDVTYATDDHETQRLWALRKQVTHTLDTPYQIAFDTPYQHTLSSYPLLDIFHKTLKCCTTML